MECAGMSGCDRIKLVHRIIPIAICAIVVLAVLYVAYRLLFPKSARARRKTSRDFPGASIARIRKTLSMHRLSGRANAIHAHGDEILSKVGLKPLQALLLRRSAKWSNTWRKSRIHRSVHALQLAPGTGDGLTSLFSGNEGGRGGSDGLDWHLREPPGSKYGLMDLSPAAQFAYESLSNLQIVGDSERFLAQLCCHAESTTFSAGTELLVQGQEVDSIFILFEGFLEISCTILGLQHNSTCGPNKEEADSLPNIAYQTSERGKILLGFSDIFLLFCDQSFSGDAHCSSVTVRAVSECNVVQIKNVRSVLTALRNFDVLAFGSTVRNALARLHQVTIQTTNVYLGLANEFRLVEWNTILANQMNSNLKIDTTRDTSSKSKLKVASNDICELHSCRIEKPANVMYPNSKNESIFPESYLPLKSSTSEMKSIPVSETELDDKHNMPNEMLPKSAAESTNEIHSSSNSQTTENVSLRNIVALALGIPLNEIPEFVPKEEKTSHFVRKSLQMQLFELNDGEKLVLNNENGPYLYVVLSGFFECLVEQKAANPFQLDTVQEMKKCRKIIEKNLFSRHETGSIIGYLSMISGLTAEWYDTCGQTPPLLSVYSRGKSLVAQVDRPLFDSLIHKYPLEMASQAGILLIRRMPHLLRVFDFGNTYLPLETNQVVVEQNGIADSLFIVLHGRFRDTHHQDKPFSQNLPKTSCEHPIRDYGRGALIGENSLITGTPYRTSTYAIRPSSVVQIPRALLAILASEYPHVVAHLALERSGRYNISSNQLNTRSFVVVPISQAAPMEAFIQNLMGAFGAVGCTVKLLTAESVAISLGLTLSDLEACKQRPIIHTSIANFIETEEDSVNILLMQADWHATTWTKLCCEHADSILYVANAADKPQISEVESELNIAAVVSNEATLCLLHVEPPPDYRPTNTRSWLSDRHLKQHFHIRLNHAAIQSVPSEFHFRNDFMRVARCLCGKAVGLVLGGGGARGMAHVGLIRALEELQIPIDLIAGTSIGALVGGLYAMNDSYFDVFPKVAKFAKRMSSTWGYIRDITLPITSYFSGFGFNQGTQQAFGKDIRIEDFWIGYLCITTDLTTSSMGIHRNGTAWRYVRGSMSLAGYLPPICDLDADGCLHLLIDGGYVNNLPSDVMKSQMGAGTVIACDVGSKWTFESHNYGDLLNGLWAFFNTKLWPFSAKLTIPSMAKISEQLAYISSVKQLQEAKSASDLYLRPPITKYGTLEFQNCREISLVGYRYACQALCQWRDLSKHPWTHVRKPSVQDDLQCPRIFRSKSFGNT